MNDYNYDDFYAFYGKNEEKPGDLNEFLWELFARKEDRPAIIRNPGCILTENVLDYLESEWMIVLAEQPIGIQKKAMDYLDKLKSRGENVQNIAGKIARKIKGA